MRNESEFQVFSAFLHTHLLGVGLRIRHFRNGTELPYLASDMNYDFNYQEQRFLNPEVTVKKVKHRCCFFISCRVIQILEIVKLMQRKF